MVSNRELSGYGLDALTDEAVASLVGDALETVDVVMDAAELLGAWLSLRGMLFASASSPSDAQVSAVEEFFAQNIAAMATPKVHVNPWGEAEFSMSALQRKKSDAEGN